MNNSIFFDTLIVIPCYNEENRLEPPAYLDSLEKNEKIAIIFSNDGSTDKTLEVLSNIESKFPDRVFVFSSNVNLGKASAVRSGFLFAFDQNLVFSKIAYLDADLSTSIEECFEISKSVVGEISFAFGSRISKIDNSIVRKTHRHFIGRFVSTLISNTLELTVYDSQCGCKVFEKSFAEYAFKDQFLSKWLFDVEIFFRAINFFGRENIKNRVREIPLKNWTDIGESKVKLSYFFFLWIDLLKIRNQYKR